MANNRALGIADNGNIGDVLVKGELLEDGVPTGTTADQQTAWASPTELTQNTAQRAFAARLASNMPAILTVLGDSTGNDDTEWPRLLTNKLAARYPARTVQIRPYRNGTKDYGPPVYVQTGPAGLGYLNPAAGGVTTADAAKVSLLNCDFLFRARIRRNNLTNAADQVLWSQWGSAGNRAAYIYIAASTGRLSIAYTENGTAATFQPLATKAETDAAFPAGTDSLLGVLFVRNNSGNILVQAQTSTDGATWSVVGTSYTAGATIATIFDSTAAVTIGVQGTNTTPFDGRIYWAEMWKGSGTSFAPAFRFDASLWTAGTSFVDADGTTWTLTGTASFVAGSPLLLVQNGSVAGAEVDYCTTNVATLCSATGTNLAIINLGHNGEKTVAQYRTFVELVKTTLPAAAVAVTRQAPAGTTSSEYARSERQVILLAELAALNGYSVIDVYSAFKATGDPDALLLAPNDVHTNAAGSALWASTAARTFGIAA